MIGTSCFAATGRRTLMFAVLCIMVSVAATTAPSAAVISISWSANSEADLAGYQVLFGTAPGQYGAPINVGNILSHQLGGLDAGTTYFLVVQALDLAGNAGDPSIEISAVPTVPRGPDPAVSSAVETSTGDSYVLQSGEHEIEVTGSDFQAGAVVDLGADISAGATTLSSSSRLTVTITVGAAAVLGDRALTVTNPDLGTDRLNAALIVVKTADIDRDCLIDAGDLQAMARAFGLVTTPPAGHPADLNGDGTVDGSDLDIYSRYFGHLLAVCP